MVLRDTKDGERLQLLRDLHKEEVKKREILPDVYLTKLIGDVSVDDRNMKYPVDAPVDPVLEFHKVMMVYYNSLFYYLRNND